MQIDVEVSPPSQIEIEIEVPQILIEIGED